SAWYSDASTRCDRSRTTSECAGAAVVLDAARGTARRRNYIHIQAAIRLDEDAGRVVRALRTNNSTSTRRACIGGVADSDRDCIRSSAVVAKNVLVALCQERTVCKQDNEVARQKTTEQEGEWNTDIRRNRRACAADIPCSAIKYHAA